MSTADQWFSSPTFHHLQFADAAALLACKQALGLRISLCIPTLNEAETIAALVRQLLPLRDHLPLLDEIAVIDSGSRDQTLDMAAAAGADTYVAAEILPEYGAAIGKGENLWKAVYQLRGDILVFLDGDITNIHQGFVTGLIGPLLADTQLGYVKACYDRPAGQVHAGAPGEGGRLTEILVRPLLAIFAPQLRWLIQPLAGEYAARRSLLEQLPFPVGYGVELAHLLDLADSHGQAVLAQTDMGTRGHRHRSNRQLGQSALALLQVLRRRQARIPGCWPDEAPVLRQFIRDKEGFVAEEVRIDEQERPPLVQVAQYRQRHRRAAATVVDHWAPLGEE